jgi:hypothetical protein
MTPAPLPYSLEDRTGLQNSDFDDIYDRIFLRVARLPQQNKSLVTMIYNMRQRASRHRDSLPFRQNPSVILEFGLDESLGNISFQLANANNTVPMSRYLRKTALFGGSLSRKFTASDGHEYRWSHKNVQGQEWSCVNAENCLVAHYDLKPPDIRAYGTSGNTLTVYEAFSHLTIELLASLTIMRHIAQHNL